MLRGGGALLALARTAEQSVLGGCIKPNLLLPMVPALSAALPTASRSLLKFGFSSSSAQMQDSKPEASAAATTEPSASADEEAGQQQGQELEQQSLEELQKAYSEVQMQLEEEREKNEDIKDKLLRTLADMENLRERTARTAAEVRQFATQNLVKSFIDVADNLERAAAAVPMDELNGDKEIDKDRALALLRSLRDGVLMTDTILMKIMEKEGVTRYDPTGEKFDPNLHNALFEVPDATKEPGTVAVVIKRGYTLHDRVVRPAEAGVVTAQDGPENGHADDQGSGP